jgi:hypothetical protein
MIDVELDLRPGCPPEGRGDRSGAGTIGEEMSTAAPPLASLRPASRPAARARAVVRDPVALAAIALVFALGVLAPAEHVVPTLLSDSYMTLFSGRWIASHGVPHAEIFTVAAHGRPWIDQQWLADLADYEAWRVGGYAGVALLSVLALGCAYALLAAIALRRGASAVVAVCTGLLAIAVTLPATFVRAQVLAMPLCALVLWLCLTDAEGGRGSVPGRRLVWLVPVLALWANLHGSVLLGAGLAAAYVAVRAVRAARAGDRRAALSCALLALACLATVLATPYGTGIVRYYTETVGNRAIAAAAPEWRAPALGSLAFATTVLLAALGLAAVATYLVRRRPLPWLLIVAGAVTGAATAEASRNEVWFALVAVLLTAEGARLWLPTRPPSRRFGVALAAGALLATGLGVGLLFARPAGWYERLTPVRALDAAARYAGDHRCVHILGDNVSASALLWHHPGLAGRVVFDARLELYPQAALRRWLVFQSGTGPGWAASARAGQVLIAGATDDPVLSRRLSRLPGARRLDGGPAGIAVATAVAPPHC